MDLPALAAASAAAVARGAARLVAVAPIARAVLTRLKWYLRFASAARADSGEHFAGRARRGIAPSTAFLLARRTAVRAASRRVREPLAGVELLLPGGEHEILTTIAALQRLVITRSIHRRHET